jgi:hypothetical protein
MFPAIVTRVIVARERRPVGHLTALSVAIGLAALVVLLAVIASGLGPLISFKRTITGYGELLDEAARLARTVEEAERRTRDLQERP